MGRILLPNQKTRHIFRLAVNPPATTSATGSTSLSVEDRDQQDFSHSCLTRNSFILVFIYLTKSHKCTWDACSQRSTYTITNEYFVICSFQFFRGVWVCHCNNQYWVPLHSFKRLQGLALVLWITEIAQNKQSPEEAVNLEDLTRIRDIFPVRYQVRSCYFKNAQCIFLLG